MTEQPTVTHYRLYRDTIGEWRWTAHAANGQIVADSGEGYVNRADASSAAAALFPAAATVHVERLEEHPVDGKPLGRHVEHDERSRSFPFEAVAPAPLRKVEWARVGSPFNQGQLGSCTGNAMAGALNTKPLHKTGVKALVEKDAVQIYEAATIIDGIPGQYPPDDTGSSGLAVAKVAKSEGKISGYRHAFTIANALQALMQGPIITGVEWFEGFDDPDANGVVTIAGQVRGGHEFEVLGYDPATDLVEAVNSWGLSYGVRGRFFFTSKLWADLLANQGDVTVPAPLAT